MDIAQISNKIARLKAEHQTLTAQDIMDLAAGRLSEDDTDKRYQDRLEEIALYQQGGEEYRKAIDLEIKREANKSKMMRWKRLHEGAWHTKPHKNDPIDYTKADRAALIAFMYASKGRRVFQVAYKWVAEKCGCSFSSAKRLIKKLAAAGLIKIKTNKISRNRNEWNTYTIECADLLKWAKRHFSRVGVKSEHDLGTLKGSCTTESKKSTKSKPPAPLKTEQNKCSSKARRIMYSAESEVLESETFMPVAKAALAEIGYTQEDNCSETDVLHEIEVLRERYQPGFKPYLWQKFQSLHGKRRTALAFLQTQILGRVRKRAGDDRPWNERELVKDKNAYLFGILSKNRDLSRPEITLSGLLSNNEEYINPPALTRLWSDQNKFRKGLKRSDSSDRTGL